MSVVQKTSRYQGKVYRPESVILDGYSNIVTCAKDEKNNVFFIGTQGEDAVIVRRDAHQLDLFEEVFRFRSADFGKSGGACVVCIGTFLVVGASQRVGESQVIRSWVLQDCGVNL